MHPYDVDDHRPISAFTTDQVARLTGLTTRRLRRWDKTDFYSPDITRVERRAYGRIYSWSDLVALRVIALLTNRYGVSLRELRTVSAWLREHPYKSWATLRFFVSGGHVFFQDDRLGVILSGKSPLQTAAQVEMQAVIREMKSGAKDLTRRAPEDIGKIAQHRHVVHNELTIAGTRIRVSTIQQFYEAGYSRDRLLLEYPRLTMEDIDAALNYKGADKSYQIAS